MKLFSLFAFITWANVIWAQVIPLPNAHAHNDYRHQRPLMEALENGFTSIEIDIHAINGDCYVAHDKPLQLREEKKIENLYFKPLVSFIEKNNGEIYPGYEGPFYLMMDFKTDAQANYQALKKALPSIQPYLTSYQNGVQKKGLITIFISGNRPIEMIKNDPQRLVAIDGRPSDLGKGYSSDLMPVISSSYRSHFSWRGRKAMPADELALMEEMVDKTHKENKRLRFWATPEKKVVWKTLKQAGVDLLNTDRLVALREFLLEESTER